VSMEGIHKAQPYQPLICAMGMVTRRATIPVSWPHDRSRAMTRARVEPLNQCA
jgi:hypothetical protein